jgi:hypothetical protein
MIAILFFAAGCTKDFEELDRPKTTSNTIEPDALFTRTLVTGSGISAGVWQWMHQISGSVYAQHVANIQVGANFTSDNYEPRAWNVPWGWYYNTPNFASMTYNYHVLKLSRELDQPLKEAPARIWNTYLIQQVTDMYGDMPLTQAFENIRPEFDSQKDVYLFMLKELQEAVQQIEALEEVQDAPRYGAADVLYYGDLDKWKRFANTMMLRLALRASNTAEFETEIRPYLTNMDVSLTMTSNDHMARILPDPAGPTYHVKNPLTFVASWNEIRMSKTMYDIFTGLNDPRMEVFFAPNAQGQYVGLENGLQHSYIQENRDTELIPNYNNYGEFLTNENTPHYLLTVAEAFLLKAEAAQRGFIGGSAEDYYNQAILSSFEQFGITDQQVIDDYINGPAKFDPANALEQIWTQRWIAVFPNGHEAWSIVRRTGVPEMMTPVYTFPGNDEMPRRKPFPDGESQYNNENYQAAVARMGGDTQYTRVWWDGGN